MTSTEVVQRAHVTFEEDKPSDDQISSEENHNNKE